MMFVPAGPEAVDRNQETVDRSGLVSERAAVVGVAAAVAGWFWLTSSGHANDEEQEPVGEIPRYAHTQEYDRMIKDNKKRRRG